MRKVIDKIDFRVFSLYCYVFFYWMNVLFVVSYCAFWLYLLRKMSGSYCEGSEKYACYLGLLWIPSRLFPVFVTSLWIVVNRNIMLALLSAILLVFFVMFPDIYRIAVMIVLYMWIGGADALYVGLSVEPVQGWWYIWWVPWSFLLLFVLKEIKGKRNKNDKESRDSIGAFKL